MVILTSQPLVMRSLLVSFARICEDGGLKESICMFSLLIGTSVLAAAVRNGYYWHVTKAGLRLRVAVTGLLFDKVSVKCMLFGLVLDQKFKINIRTSY